MLNKLYVKVKEIIYKNYKMFIAFLIILFTLTFQLPLYINYPGGIIDISKKIDIENKYDIEGSFNFAYVSELKATIPTLLIALFNDNWDILQQEEVVYENETNNDAYFRNHLLLEEANQNAIIVAYKKANKEVVIKNRQLFITYVDVGAKTNLEVGDQIIQIEGQSINSKEELGNIISNNNIGDVIEIQIKKDDKIFTRSAEILEEENRKIIGIMVSEKKDIITTPKITFSFDKAESGPSGGLMVALSIYNYLVPDDITKGYKIAGTGTIDSEGNVGSIGGLEYKLKGVINEKVKVFLVPNGENYQEALKIKESNNYDITIVPISSFDEAINYLKNM